MLLNGYQAQLIISLEGGDPKKLNMIESLFIIQCSFCYSRLCGRHESK